jgi:hypothetical protein
MQGAHQPEKRKKGIKEQKARQEETPALVDTSFEFRTAVRILKSTGKKASGLRHLRELLTKVSAECIIHHTCQYFSKGHIQQYTNDFAQWVGEHLEEGALAEQLSNIDSYSFTSTEDLRGKLIEVIDSFLDDFPEPRDVLPGDEFYFNEVITFIFPLGLRARNLAEFLMALKYLEGDSIYYHFYESRIRLGRGVDDFSKWVDEVAGAYELAEKIRAIDPFMHNIEGIRERLVEVIEQGLRQEMEVME